jgi:hypothetical protein
LAEAIYYSTGAAGLIERVRSEPVGVVLSSMLQDNQDATLLGVLSLFEQLGYDEGFARETTIVCAAFGIDEKAFRRLVDREEGRFVSRAGRYRLVTPKLFAVWLTSEYIRRETSLSDALRALPDTLLQRVTGQMTAFAGDPSISTALANLFERPPFDPLNLSGIDEGRGRLIQVAAVVDPPLAMRVIDRTLSGRSIEELRSGLIAGQRPIVEALELLLWFEETFEQAASALLVLALAENESWSNNATGVLQGVFRIYLGGTSVSYATRMEWARTISDKPGAATVLIGGLENAFLLSETRGSPDFASRTPPSEWRPGTQGEEVEARRSAWELLVHLGQRAEERGAVAQALSGALRAAVRVGLVETVFADVLSISWTPSERATFADEVEKVLRYDEPPARAKRRLEELLVRLQGANRQDRIQFLLATPPWKLVDPRDPSALSPLLLETASSLAQDDLETIVGVAQSSRAGDQQSASVLFQRVALQSNDESLLSQLEREAPGSDGALIGVLTGLAATRESRWAARQLARWIDSPLGRLVIEAVHRLPADPTLADLAINAVTSGHATPTELGRLLYGAWAAELPVATVLRMVGLLAETGDAHAIEGGLGILSQWLDKNTEYDDRRIDEVALELIRLSADLAQRSDGMIAFYREHVLARLRLSTEQQLSVLAELLSHVDSFLSSSDLTALDAMANKAPTDTISVVFSSILGEEGVFSSSAMWLQQAHLLSRVAQPTSYDQVIAQLRMVPQDRWKELVAHVDFSGDQPSPLVEVLITESSDSVLHARAAQSFMYPEMAWFGSESSHLRTRISVAEKWRTSTDLQAMRTWLDQVILDIRRSAAQAELREAERRD